MSEPKVKLTLEQAAWLEGTLHECKTVRKACNPKVDLLIMAIRGEIKRPPVTFHDLATALYAGYESPHDAIRELYIGHHFKRSVDFVLAYREGIRDVLDELGIKVKGINQ